MYKNPLYLRISFSAFSIGLFSVSFVRTVPNSVDMARLLEPVHPEISLPLHGDEEVGDSSDISVLIFFLEG